MSDKSKTCCYQIGKNYSNLTVWFFDPKTRLVAVTTKLKPFPKATRRERYDIIAEHLARVDIVIPAYTDTKGENGKKK